MNDLKNTISELFNDTPPYIGVGYGDKITNNINTGVKSIVFTVYEKLPIDELEDNEVLPSEVNMNGETIPTDVIEVGIIEALACSVEDPCYNGINSYQHSGEVRPLKGGIGLGGVLSYSSMGTLGGFVIDNETGTLVGLTNAHVAVKKMFKVEGVNDVLVTEYYNTTKEIGAAQPHTDKSKIIGGTKRYIPLTPSNIDKNKVDAALLYITDQASIDTAETWKQHNITSISSSAPPFATTTEIDDLILDPTSYSIVISGARMGRREPGYCDVQVAEGNVYSTVGYSQGSDWDSNITPSAPFEDLISLKRPEEECLWPIWKGDSGSMVLALIGGVWKIIGLVFAAANNGSRGYMCRIDNIATELNVSAWDGSTPTFDNPSPEKLYVKGYPTASYIDHDGKRYWQVGLVDHPSESNGEYTPNQNTASLDLIAEFDPTNPSNFSGSLLLDTSGYVTSSDFYLEGRGTALTASVDGVNCLHTHTWNYAGSEVGYTDTWMTNISSDERLGKIQTAFTLEMWVRPVTQWPTGSNTDATLARLGFFDGVGGQFAPSGDYSRFEVSAKAHTNQNTFWSWTHSTDGSGAGLGGTSNAYGCSPPDHPMGFEWFHVTSVIAPNEDVNWFPGGYIPHSKIYVNGTEQCGRSPREAFAKHPQSRLHIVGTNTYQYYVGRVRIYNYARSVENILNDYTTTKGIYGHT